MKQLNFHHLCKYEHLHEDQNKCYHCDMYHVSGSNCPLIKEATRNYIIAKGEIPSEYTAYFIH